MRKSIWFKLFISITILALLIMSISWFMNTKYLEKYYIFKKKEKLVEYGNDIESLYINKDENLEHELTKIENELNGKISLLDNKNQFVYYSDSKGMLCKFNSDLTKENNTIIDMYTYNRFGMKFLVLNKLMKDNSILIMQIPIAPIKESVHVVNSFYWYIGIISILVSIVFAYLFSKKFTKPIIELNLVAKDMLNLDFSKKYEYGKDDEIGQLSYTINQLSRRLHFYIEKLKDDIEKERELDKIRKEFIANVSHELKTPISLIQGYAEGLKENVLDAKEDKEFYCDVIIDESDKMNKLIKELLNLSKLQSRKVNLNKNYFDIVKLIEETNKKYKNIFLERNITYEIEYLKKDIMINGDYYKIEQVLTNLTNNAINHVDYDKRIGIKIYEKDNKVMVTVKNTGPNIEEKHINKIWESFYKGDVSRNRTDGGTGLGLAIVKEIIELHNGEYGVDNQKDGVAFWFNIPI
ncbi:sensor histidine kinase [Anaeromicrobium sediminis]|uniref:histidine kinase n=1 Tax=Anaeromicrobium sediminis TaxID=1478221 RepID=A0A267MLY6_9FIRM|nr:HAMP domain-containing sensor histidine kinase [Anaeromicrobium sediminis]PAB59918.1 hypothetical protein CCE28_08165 [Anaeromicrobium sediminis]